MKKFYILLMTAVISVGLLSGCSKSSGSLTVNPGKFTMATNAEFPPYEFREGEEIKGIDVEIATAIAESMGLEVAIEDMNFDSIITAVQSGKADVGIAGMTVTEDRLKNVDFSETYITASQVVIVKADNTDISSPDDLVGKKVGVQLGTTGDIYAEDIENVQLERYSKGFEAVQALKQGKIDAVIIDDQPAKVFVSQNDDIKTLDEEFTVEEYAIAIKKGNTELVDAVNSAIKELKDSGKLQEIFDKYITAE